MEKKKGKTYLRPHVNCPIFLPYFKSMEFLHRSLYIPLPTAPNFREISPVVAALYSDTSANE